MLASQVVEKVLPCKWATFLVLLKRRFMDKLMQLLIAIIPALPTGKDQPCQHSIDKTIRQLAACKLLTSQVQFMRAERDHNLRYSGLTGGKACTFSVNEQAEITTDVHIMFRSSP